MGGAGQDYGAIVNGQSGSLLDLVTATPDGLFVAMAGATAGLEGIPFGNYWLFARGPASTIEQQVLVPTETGSLQFRAFGVALAAINVYIDGVAHQAMLRAPVETHEPIPYGLADVWVDMSAYQGKSVSIKFRMESIVGLDGIFLSPDRVPEPGMMALCGMGALALLGLRRSQPD